jgi:hypothetical protein
MKCQAGAIFGCSDYLQLGLKHTNTAATHTTNCTPGTLNATQICKRTLD